MNTHTKKFIRALEKSPVKNEAHDWTAWCEKVKRAMPWCNDGPGWFSLAHLMYCYHYENSNKLCLLNSADFDAWCGLLNKANIKAGELNSSGVLSPRSPNIRVMTALMSAGVGTRGGPTAVPSLDELLTPAPVDGEVDGEGDEDGEGEGGE